jgi:probable phosphoglycerate mutase
VTGVTAWYIRHGHNPANQARQLSHKVIDYPLTDLGVAQATTLARQLAGEPGPAAIYASPLRRAAQTAEIIAARTSSDVMIVEGLRELDVGDLDGRCDEEAWAVYHQVLAGWRAGRHDSAFPGGEDYFQMTARLACVMRGALRHPPGSRVLMVGHGGIIRAAIPALCPGSPVPGSDLPKCGIAELALRPVPAECPGLPCFRIHGELGAGPAWLQGQKGTRQGHWPNPVAAASVRRAMARGIDGFRRWFLGSARLSHRSVSNVASGHARPCR